MYLNFSKELTRRTHKLFSRSPSDSQDIGLPFPLRNNCVQCSKGSLTSSYKIRCNNLYLNTNRRVKCKLSEFRFVAFNAESLFPCREIWVVYVYFYAILIVCYKIETCIQIKVALVER